MADYIKSCNGFKGNGMAYYIEGHDDMKFKLSNFKEKYDTIPEFRKMIEDTAREYLRASIRESDNLLIAEQTALEKNENGGVDEQ